MATSAFKSTTRRGSEGGCSSTAARRSRSLSRFSRPIERRLDDAMDESKKGVRAGFSDAARGTAVQFPEISLDDLALEFFSSSSSWNENGSDGGVVREREGRQGRSVSRRGEIGRWASDTASSRRKSRSVSRTRGEASSRPAVVRERNVSSSGAGPRRRRSLSVARQQISEYENSSTHSNVKAPTSGNGQTPLATKATASSNRRLRRTQSFKDLPMSQDGYSTSQSHSSALTDDESKDAHVGRNGFEKIIRPVYSQKKREPPTKDVADGGLYEVMRQELRYAVEEIRTELNQAMSRNQTALPVGHSLQTNGSETFEEFSGIRKKYSTNWEQLEMSKQDFPDSRTSSVVEKPSQARKRSSDRHRVSRRLIEEAEKYFEGFISNVEDTDLSSFEGERSDGSSTLGGRRRPKDSAIRVTTTLQSSVASNSCPGEMEGVLFPWLEWETSHDGSSSANTEMRTPVTPKALRWDLEKDAESLHGPINHSGSSQGSWSPAVFTSRGTKRDARPSTQQLGIEVTSRYDLDEYLNLKKNEEVLLEKYRERNQIETGRLLLCTSFPRIDSSFLML